jgi:tetratricopeptide (TPR) repeat protein
VVGSFKDVDGYFNSNINKIKAKKTVTVLPSVLEMHVPVADDELVKKQNSQNNKSQSGKEETKVKKTVPKRGPKKKKENPDVWQTKDDFSRNYSEGLMQLDKGNNKEAIRHFKKAVECDPFDRAARSYLIEALKREMRSNPKLEKAAERLALATDSRYTLDSQSGDTEFFSGQYSEYKLSSRESRGILDSHQNYSTNGFLDDCDFTRKLVKRGLIG